MKYDLVNVEETKKFMLDSDIAIQDKELVEFRTIKATRTNLQNKSLHLYFKMIATALNDAGMTYKWHGLKGNPLEARYNEITVKEFVWKPLQLHLFKIESTTQLTTKMINEIIDTFSLFFGEKGIEVYFPSIETLINRRNEKEFEKNNQQNKAVFH